MTRVAAGHRVDYRQRAHAVARQQRWICDLLDPLGQDTAIRRP